MKTIYLLSVQPFAGKTFISIGLMAKLKELGYGVGYIKPVGLTPQKIGNSIYDTDAILIKELFSLEDPLDIISPWVITPETFHTNSATTNDLRAADKIQETIRKSLETFKDRDFVLIGGAGNIFTGSVLGCDALSLIETFNSRVLIIESFSGDSSMDNIIGLSKMVKNRLLGAIINKIPDNAMSMVKQNLKPFLESQGIRILGTFPRDPILESLSIRDIVALLNARVLCCEDRLDELVEHFTVGAMDVDSALRYFRRIPNKAVITGAHRSDIQLAAMETSTKVIILTGGTGTNDVVIAKAISKGIPLLSVEMDTFSTVERIEFLLGKSRIKEPKKVERLKELFSQEFEINAFLEAINSK